MDKVLWNQLTVSLGGVFILFLFFYTLFSMLIGDAMLFGNLLTSMWVKASKNDPPTALTPFHQGNQFLSTANGYDTNTIKSHSPFFARLDLLTMQP